MVVLENIRYPTSGFKYAEQNTEKPSNNRSILKLNPVFVLCERCYWCTTYLDTNRLLKEDGVDDDNSKICPRCDAIDSLSSFPILSNESFKFDYTVRRGIVLQFRTRN